ncbi:MAG: hypothetical protein KDC34_11810 [Saprospiraceae bacterium]|nr:hypothetical protein [Saprospiraceae bacterium]
MPDSNSGSASGDGLCQLIRLNFSGAVIHSSNTLFAVPIDLNIVATFPLLESIFQSLIESNTHSEAYEYFAVETTFPGLDGFYDFRFVVLEEFGENVIDWTICDRTTYYRQIQADQQKNNEAKLRN